MITPRILESIELKGKLVTLRTPSKLGCATMQKILSNPITMSHLKYLAHLPNGWTLKQVEERFKKQLNAQKNQTGAQGHLMKIYDE